MIGRIHGRIIERTATQVVVDASGVGYEIDIPASTVTRIAELEVVTLYTHLSVREDAHQLFGFHSSSERDLFRALIRVNGVGPRLALTILSGMDAAGLARCIRTRDIKGLVALPGVGKKTAERVVLDLEDRLPELEDEVAALSASGTVRISNSLADAESALIGLGFKPQEAALALAQIEDQDADVETLIKQALKALA